MKKVLFFIFVLVLCVCLAGVCFAQGEVTEDFDVKAYIQERVVPVAVGVLTSILALGTMLFKITSALKSLKNTKESFESEATLRARLSREIQEQAREIKEAVEDLPNLKERVESLVAELRLNSEILSLGFSANAEVIKSGKGRKMSSLLEGAVPVEDAQGYKDDLLVNREAEVPT